jgi:hypothetical protein
MITQIEVDSLKALRDQASVAYCEALQHKDMTWFAYQESEDRYNLARRELRRQEVAEHSAEVQNGQT